VWHTDQLFKEELSLVVCVAVDEEANKGKDDGSVGDDKPNEDMTLCEELVLVRNTMDGNSTAFATSKTTHITAIQDHALSAAS
jgi:hypothetical protein